MGDERRKAWIHALLSIFSVSLLPSSVWLRFALR